MPKKKTHKGTAKRFRVTGTGKIMRGKAFKSHILEKKSPEAQARLPPGDRRSHTADTKVIKKNLGLG